MRYVYFICDVFTDTRFGGNQLAVLPQAAGLSDHQMQLVAREFNFAESAFVFPSTTGHTRKVRIFTPIAELPFAGHPNIGTAFTLATTGELGAIDGSVTVTFEEKAGVVPITVRQEKGQPIWCELKAPQPISYGKKVARDIVANAVSLAPEDLVTGAHSPQVASVGLPFLIAEVKNLDTLGRARPNMTGIDRLVSLGIVPDIHLYTHCDGPFDIRARMFAPLDGMPEDPATGSANCALVGMLSDLHPAANGDFHWRIGQGIEMGRPSVLTARTEKRESIVSSIWIGGASVLVSEGTIEVD